MKKVLIASLFFCLITPISLFAGGSSSDACKTKYPIILAHGMGTQVKVLGIVDYWFQIPDALTDEGAKVFTTNVNAMDGTAAKGLAWKQQVLQILAITGAAKVNVIGHSHGGIYTRYAISNLGLASKIASYTSLCSPHRGSVLADIIMGVIPGSLQSLVGSTLDLAMGFLMGDVGGDSLQNGRDLVRSNMINVFNPNTPNMAGIYYQSWAAKIKDFRAGEVMLATWLLMFPFEGANDGLVAETSAKWGNFRGTISGAWWCGGVNHFHMVNQILGFTPGFDAPQFYVDLVSNLKSRGF